MTPPAGRVSLAGVEGVLLDLDGVLTPTAIVHQRAWKETFDRLLRQRDPLGFEPFSQEDYLRHVDGKRRVDGVRDFLASRGIRLPTGAPSDPPGTETLWAVGNAKNEAFQAELVRGGVEPYPDALRFLASLEGAGTPSAVVSSSANARAVLAAAGLEERFAVVVDGIEARRLGLAGKPAPDTFLEASRRLGARPSATAVAEDAVSGVEAGVAGGFRPVVGVARAGDGEQLLAAGAHAVVADLDGLTL